MPFSRLTARIPKAVIALGAVSFLTDLSSEMIYPLLPIFLATVLGAGAVTLGLIEGVAESTAALLKVASGIWTDRTQKRKPLIVSGYSLSGLVRPLIGLATVWPAVLALRFADRVGKGLRTSPRDALIADVTDASARGTAYGFHRSMDHAGAVVGPLVAALLLTTAGLPLRQVFLLAAVPAALVLIVLLCFIKEPTTHRADAQIAPRLSASWNALGGEYRRLLLAVFVFTLGNSTDAFLLLRLGGTGVSAAWIAVLWSAHHGVKMAATYFGGRLADRIGPRPMMAAGWIFYAAIYLAFGWLNSAPLLTGVFLAYGVYFGFVEPAERAWIASLVPPHLRGTAFGWYHCTIGIATLPASLVFGLLWQRFGTGVAFTTGALLAATATILLLVRNTPHPMLAQRSESSGNDFTAIK
ncbi:MAG: MFS transporter [Chthoniobacter sp.]|uniref:MFS transporter n=1 Tax=Chthoniobacter sp. TaxID=2510640 RepID=UPI00326C28D6